LDPFRIQALLSQHLVPLNLASSFPQQCVTSA
jgi:hypothetical protein